MLHYRKTNSASSLLLLKNRIGSWDTLFSPKANGKCSEHTVVEFFGFPGGWNKFPVCGVALDESEAVRTAPPPSCIDVERKCHWDAQSPRC